MREHLHRLGVNSELLDDIAIALTEAVANVVRHAYRNGDAGSFEAEIAIQAKGIEVTVRDTGCGLLPNPESEGIGMGFPLMHRLADHVHIDGEPGHGTTVHMWFGAGMRPRPEPLRVAVAQLVDPVAVDPPAGQEQGPEKDARGLRVPLDPRSPAPACVSTEE